MFRAKGSRSRGDLLKLRNFIIESCTHAQNLYQGYLSICGTSKGSPSNLSKFDLVNLLSFYLENVNELKVF